MALIYAGPEKDRQSRPLLGFSKAGILTIPKTPLDPELVWWRRGYRRGEKYPIGRSPSGKPIYAIVGAATESLFLIANSTNPTTAAPVVQPTGTAIRTMLQIEGSATQSIDVVEWGISYDGSAAAAGIKTEFFSTTVAATMSTASVSGDVTQFTGPLDQATTIVFGGTTHTGFATAAVTEGTVANYRYLDGPQLIQPTNQYIKQYPLGREPRIGTTKLMRVRVTAGASVNAYIYVIWRE